MMDTGQNLATHEDARRRPKSALAERLLALDVGGYFLAPVGQRATYSGLMTRWAARSGRRWKMRRMLRRDGTVKQVRIERII